MSDLPDEILPALDFLEEHGFNEAADLIRSRAVFFALTSDHAPFWDSFPRQWWPTAWSYNITWGTPSHVALAAELEDGRMVSLHFDMPDGDAPSQPRAMSYNELFGQPDLEWQEIIAGPEPLIPPDPHTEHK